MIVDGDAVVDPGAVVVFFSDTALAAFAVFAAEGFAEEAGYAEGLLIEVFGVDEFLDDGSFFASAVGFWEPARVFEHA